MTVTLGEAESQRFGQELFDAKKFRIPSNTESFEVVRKSNLKIVLKDQDGTEYQGESCEWRAGSGGPFSCGCVCQAVLHVIGLIIGKWFGCW